jgi:hypothetical protein
MADIKLPNINSYFCSRKACEFDYMKEELKKENVWLREYFSILQI